MMQHLIASQLGLQRGNYRGRKRLELRSIHKYPGEKPPELQAIGTFYEPMPILADSSGQLEIARCRRHG